MSSTIKTVGNVIIIASIPVIVIVLFYSWAYSLTGFKVHKNLSHEEKASQAEQALMPELTDYIDRYGLRGFQDIDLQIETIKFDSIDELVETFPYLACYENAETHEGNDVKNNRATIYEIATYSTSNGRTGTSRLPLDTSSINSDSHNKNWTWKYSIYEYKDGSCRFVILVMPY